MGGELRKDAIAHQEAVMVPIILIVPKLWLMRVAALMLGVLNQQSFRLLTTKLSVLGEMLFHQLNGLYPTMMDNVLMLKIQKNVEVK